MCLTDFERLQQWKANRRRQIRILKEISKKNVSSEKEKNVNIKSSLLPTDDSKCNVNPSLELIR